MERFRSEKEAFEYLLGRIKNLETRLKAVEEVVGALKTVVSKR